jgi:hypothetical protein
VRNKDARIGWIPSSSNSAVASTRLRCGLPCRYLRESGWDVQILDSREPYRYDLVVFQKMYDEEAIELARSLGDKGVRTAFDLCDNHFYNPDDLPVLTARAERLRRMLDAVDAVSVSTEPLRDLIRDHFPAVIDDALDEFRLAETGDVLARLRARLRPGSESIRLVWYGNAGLDSPSFGLPHIRTILPALEDLHRRVPLELTVISNSHKMYDEVLREAPFPARYIEWKYETFPARFRYQDVCLIPIERNPFTICKTSNRVALSLNLGVPVIADRIPSFEEFSDFILLGEWPESLERYVTDSTLREHHASAGSRYVKATYTKERVVSQWSSFLERVLSTDARTQSNPQGVSTG